MQAAAIYGALREHKVSHFCAAPIVLNMLNNADPALKQGLDHPVKAMTAGAAPPATVIAGMEAMGIAVTHVYGLTETMAPAWCASRKDAGRGRMPLLSPVSRRARGWLPPCKGR